MSEEAPLTLSEYITASRVLSTRWDSREQWEAWARSTALLVEDEDGNLINGPRVQHTYLNGPSGFEVTAPVLDADGKETVAGTYDPRWHVDTFIEAGADPAIFASLVAFLVANGEEMPAAEQNNHEAGTRVASIGGVALDPRTFSSPSHRFLK